MIAGVLAAGLAGAAVQPDRGRLRGIYLGVASLGLVFIGQHVLNKPTSVTGGFNGASAPEFSAVRLHLRQPDPSCTSWASRSGRPSGSGTSGWSSGLAAYLFARNLVRSRPGRALQTLRDSEVAASVMGVNVSRYKARVFLVSSMYAGLAGVLHALVYRPHRARVLRPRAVHRVPGHDRPRRARLGGRCAVLGAVFVTALPLVFQRYADVVPFVGGPGRAGSPPVRRRATSSASRSSSSSSSSRPVWPAWRGGSAARAETRRRAAHQS